MDEEAKATLVRWLTMVAGILLFVWIFLVLVSMSVPLFGYGYLPSTEFVSKTASLRLCVGLAAAVFVTVFSIKKIDIEAGELKKIVSVLVSPFIGYFMGSAPIAAGVPMLVAAMAGHHVELTYVISRVDSAGGKGCRSPIELQDLPFLLERLCGVPDDLRAALKPRMEIVVEGRGTSLGVYATAFHRVGS